MHDWKNWKVCQYPHTICYAHCCTSFLFAAKNNALQMTLAVKECATTMISHRGKGHQHIQPSGGHGACGWWRDIQPPSSESYQHAHLSLTHDCSALSRTYQLKQGLIVQYCGTANPKNLSARLLELYVSFSSTFYFFTCHIFLPKNTIL